MSADEYGNSTDMPLAGVAFNDVLTAPHQCVAVKMLEQVNPDTGKPSLTHSDTILVD